LASGSHDDAFLTTLMRQSHAAHPQVMSRSRHEQVIVGVVVDGAPVVYPYIYALLCVLGLSQSSSLMNSWNVHAISS